MTRTAGLTRVGPSIYSLAGQPDSRIWREGEGPGTGKWLFDLGRGNGVSEPYDTLRAAALNAKRAAPVNEEDKGDRQ
jgi:hypothetical protein